MTVYSPQAYCLTNVLNLGYFGGDCLNLTLFILKKHMSYQDLIYEAHKKYQMKYFLYESHYTYC